MTLQVFYNQNNYATVHYTTYCNMPAYFINKHMILISFAAEHNKSKALWET